MCGIAGWVDFQQDLGRCADELRAMAGTQACRGPDAEGTWISTNAAIAHRRLAVIDLDTGDQPMTVRRGGPGSDVVISFSGEVYNFRELREELRRCGHTFGTRSDTEVVLRSYLQWGQHCVERFSGMFAFAVWDEEYKQLTLGRDRLGVKPLYYHRYSGGLLFGSEPKAILANSRFDPVLDDEGILELFANFGTQTPGNGVLRDLDELRPGWTLVVDAEGMRQRQYWQLESHPHEDSEPETIERVRSLLTGTVSEQLVSDVPLCALVSGGIDSSVIAALASEELSAADGEKLRTFAVDFANSSKDFYPESGRPDLDAPFVHTLAEHIGSAHTDLVLESPDLLQVQNRTTAARDLPSLGELDASLHLLFRAIRGDSTVALSGEAADEVFGGYPWFWDPAAFGRDGFPWSLDDLGFANVLRTDLIEKLQPERYVHDRYVEALNEVPRLPGETGTAARMREVNYLALTRFLPTLLDRKDRMSMAVGLEVRVPFCDHRLVEYAWNMPWELKSLGGEEKGVLRAAVDDVLPDKLLRRPKSMYPVTADPGYDSAVRSAALSLVDSPSTIGPLLDGEKVRAIASGTSRRPQWLQRIALAYLVQVEQWMNTYNVRFA